MPYHYANSKCMQFIRAITIRITKKIYVYIIKCVYTAIINICYSEMCVLRVKE